MRHFITLIIASGIIVSMPFQAVSQELREISDNKQSKPVGTITKTDGSKTDPIDFAAILDRKLQRGFENQPSEPVHMITEADWSTTDPIDFMAILKKNKGRWVTVHNVPENWIKKTHIDQLIHLVHSKEPAAPVVSLVSSYCPLHDTSTVGNEAMFIIEGFIQGSYPPGICSVYPFKGNPEDYIKWYGNRPQQ